MIAGPRRAPELQLQLLCMAAAAMAAVLARWWGGYPNCPTDELNWSHIARQLDQGQAWPVSGPLHVAALQMLSRVLQLGYEQTLAVMAVAFVPLAIGVLLWCYRSFQVRPMRWALLALCLSSYFWAALIESRPQQWGQILVLLGSVSLWLALCERGSWWWYAAWMLLTAVTHILSYALLLMLSVWIVAYFYLLRECALPAAGRWLAAVAVSGAVFVVPGGPYAAMLQDIAGNHLRGSAQSIATLSLLLLGLLGVLLATRDRIRTAVVPWFEHRLHRVRNRPGGFALAAAVLGASALGLQALILPPDAWRPYDGSVLRFVFSQSGNLMFATLVMIGWIDVVTQVHSAPALRAFAVMSLGWAAIGGALLLASLFLLDTNWLLRVLNYAVLFAAPLAAGPLVSVWRRGRLAWVAIGGMVAIRFVLALRHLGIYSC